MKTEYKIEFLERGSEAPRRISSVPHWCKHPVGKYSQINYYTANNTKLIIQTLHTEMFSIDLAEMRNKGRKSKNAKLYLDQNLLFQIFVFKGSLTIKTVDGFMIGEFKKGYFYLTHNCRNEYLLMTQSKELEVLIIGIKKENLQNIVEKDIITRTMIEKFFSGDQFVSVLPGNKILPKHYNQLNKVYSYIQNSSHNSTVLNSMLSYYTHQSIEDYMWMLKHDDKKLYIDIRQYIESHCTDSELSLSMLARYFEISIDALRYNFKKQYSQTVYNYIIQCRMLFAKRLMDTENLKVSDVYQLVGFNNLESFYYHFKKYFGNSQSP